MTKIIITIVLGLIGATAVGVMYFSNMDTEIAGVEEGMMATQATNATASADELSGSASILDLMGSAAGKSMECTFIFTGSDTRSEGTGFFAQDKARVDMLNTDATNVQVASYMIMDKPSDAMYVWTLANGQETGMKMSISENEKFAAAMQANTPPAGASAQTQPMSPETALQYNCKPWSPDMTVFIPPKDVEFMDMSEMQKMMGDMSGGMGNMRIPEM
jgi:hypothetical protein